MAAKRKSMGEAAKALGIGAKHTGAEALSAMTGASSPAPSRPAKAAPPAEPMFTTTIRITFAQAEALKSEAMRLQRKRAEAGGALVGKADVSEVVRGLLDGWMRDRKG